MSHSHNSDVRTYYLNARPSFYCAELAVPSPTPWRFVQRLTARVVHRGLYTVHLYTSVTASREWAVKEVDNLNDIGL